VLIREIPGTPPYRIQACYLEATYCNYKTILNVSPTETTDLSMKYIAGVLNSRLLSFVYPYISNKTLAKSFPRLSVGDLKRLPIRPIDFSDPADKARHDKMVTLVDRMLEMNRKKHSGKLAPSELDRLVREIATTDREIDELVYDLYAITDEERKIIEGGLRRSMSADRRS
jgi:hypothetical protein